MHPELRAYLNGYYARTMARYDAMDRKLALMSKILAGVSTPQPACPLGTAADDAHTDDASVPAVVPDIFTAITQAQEPTTVAHDAPSVCIEMVPATCLTECLTQVSSIASVDEVHDAATATHPEPVVDLIHQEVAYGDSGYVWWPPDHQLRMRNESQARLSPTQHASVVVHLFQSVKNPGTLSAELSSHNDLQLMQFKQKQYSPDRALYNAEVQSTGSRLQNAIQLWALDISAGFNMAGLEEISCHGIFAIHTGYLISCMSRPCPWPSFDCFHEGAQLRYTWPKITPVMHHFAGSLHSPTEPLRCRQRMHLKLLCSPFSSNCQAVQLWSKLPTVEFQISAHGSTDPHLMRESWWCLQKIIYKISHMEHLFRPRPWRSLKYDSVAGYLEEPSSGTHHQPHEVSGFSVELVPLPFSDVSSPQVPSRQSNSMEESFCRLPGAKLQSGRPPDRATVGHIIQMPPVRVRISHMGHWFRPRPWPSFKYDSNASHPEESCSGIRSRPHDISGFSSGLVLLYLQVFVQRHTQYMNLAITTRHCNKKISHGILGVLLPVTAFITIVADTLAA